MSQKIAVIGLSGLFPGSETLEQFWENLENNKDCRSVATEKQMGRDPKAFLGKQGDDDSFYCIHGGYINNFKMDARDLLLSEERLQAMDDVHLWSLFVAREALRDSGYLKKKKPENTGVILGNLSFPTKQSNQLFIPVYHKAINSALIDNLQNEELILPRYANAEQVSRESGLLAGYPAALLAEAFALKGTHFCLDAACASSLYSVKLACDYLQTGRADLMLAGAVSAADPFFVNLGFSVFQAYPENQLSAPLDKRSQGLFAGEGAGMLVLKRYEDAVADGDHIRAVILGGGLSNDGKGQHVLSPNTKGQVKAFERAYRDADVNPATIDYIECHATGTPLGDKVELTSLESFFTPYLQESKSPAPNIGSVKSNLGHLLTAAGMPAIAKVILAMEHEKIPASINLQQKQKSPKSVFSEDNICSENLPWQKSKDKLRRAGVSVFGFGGANAHMVFEEVDSKSKTKKSDAKKNKLAAPSSLAVIGMDAHFGPCDSLKSFEALLMNGEQAFVDLPKNRWRGLEQEQLLKNVFGEQTPKGAYIESFELDFLNFRLPPHLDDRLIPQQLLLMKVADNALKDAGIEKGGKVAVLVAMGTELELHQIRARVNLGAQFKEMWVDHEHSKNYSDKQKQEIESLSKSSIHSRARLNQYTSAIGNIMASRISSLWDFSGPAFTVSAEENSVFQALELAQLMFDKGEVETVVLAAVDLSASVESLLLRQQFGQINHAGSGFSFANETGKQSWNVGEGAGALVLKNTRQLGEDFSGKVYAQIDALAFEQGVDSKALQAACEKALKHCDYDLAALEYLELCASGIENQDKSEQEALIKLSRKYKVQAQQLALGSVKNSIGHTFSASGIASLIKTCLCLHNRFIPAVSQWQKPQSAFDSDSYYIPQKTKTWFKDKQDPIRKAGINSMGLDGRSCFVALSEYKSHADKKQCHSSLPRSNSYLFQSDFQLITLAADSPEALLEKLKQFENELPKTKFKNLSLLAAHAHKDFEACKQQMKQAIKHQGNTLHILSLVVENYSTLNKEISLAKTGIVSAQQKQQDWFSPSGSYYSPKPIGPVAKVAFVYPGAFNSYLNIAKDLGQLFPELHELFAQHSGQAATLFADRLYYPRKMEALSHEQEKALQKALPDEAISSFENGISVSVIFTDIFNKIFAMKPQIAFGYSMGEISMMYALGVWGTTDVMSKRLRSNPVFQTRLAGSMDTLREAWKLDKKIKDGTFWTAFALLAPVEKIREAVKNENYVRLILINTANEAVIAGKPEDCRRVAESLNCDFFEAALGDVIHCDLVRPEYDNLKALHVLAVEQNLEVDFYTAVGNKKLKISSEDVAKNIAEMYCNPVDFKTLTEKVYEEGARIFVELGARDGNSRHIEQILQGKEHLCVSVNRKGASDKVSLLRALAKLNSHGADIDLCRLYPEIDLEQENKKHLVINIEVGGKRIFDQLDGLKAIAQMEVSDKELIAPVSVSNPQINPLIKMAKEKVVNKANDSVYNPVHNPVTEDSCFDKAAATIDKISAHADSVKPFFKNEHYAVNANANNNHADSKSQINAEIYQGFQKNIATISGIHEVFLDSRQQSMKEVAALLAKQLAQVATGRIPASSFSEKAVVVANPVAASQEVGKMLFTQHLVAKTNASPLVIHSDFKIANFDQVKVKYPDADLKNVIWDSADLIEFAEGDIANVFGEEYKIIDSYSRRVRLPTTEYLLVDRVTKLNAQMNQYEPCSMTTEYDVPYDFWYSVQGQIPWAVAVESGQCDLLLIAYLGIDFQNKGERVYRLLDCELTFMDDVAMEGDTLRYDISINSYAQSGDCFLFFFSYNCYVGDKLVLKMRNGSAGFFNDQELEAGKGVIETEAEKQKRLKIAKQSFTPLLHCHKTQFSYQDMMALCHGDLATCFGESYAQEGLNPNLVYSAPKMLMIERITEVNPKGGSYGLGLIVGEKTLAPDHWYFPCHFKGDQVMAGSLMSDGCSQLLRFYSWYLGLHTLTQDAVFQPMPGLAQKVRCRGQVSPQHATLVYRMEITEIGMHPKPYAKANVDIILNGKIVVDFKNLGLFLGEVAGTDLEKKINRRKRVLAGDYSNELNPQQGKIANSALLAATLEKTKQGSKVLHPNHVYVPGKYELREHPFSPFPGNPLDKNATPDTIPFTQYHFIEFASGRIANCFGENFGAIYDGRTPPRTPNADLQLTSRVLEIDGERNHLKRVSSCVAEFDCPADAWFFTQNHHPDLMPYSIIMEISLQPNGFISAWVGTTLLFPEKDLFFRNLDGSGTLLRDVDLRGKTIRNESVLLSTTSAGNTIIQSFKFNLSVDGEKFYEGTSVFGYFLKDALTHQLGLDNGRIAKPWHIENPVAENILKTIDMQSSQAQQKYYQASTQKPFYHLAGPQLNLLDTVVVSATAGKHNAGYIYAQKSINPNDWFFPCHFHQDPVMPGSLGVEAILQAMQIWALENDLGAPFNNPRFTHDLTTVKWKYRGQIIPDNKIMSLDVHISRVENKAGKITVFADASLYKDGLRIYELANAQIALIEAQ